MRGRPKTVQYLAGHENSQVTMDIYAKAKYNRPEELSDVVNGALTPQAADTMRAENRPK
jgi:integrase